MNISIKTKIIINAICISIISIVIAGSLIVWRSETLGTEFLTKTEKERLTSIRYFKSQQVETYFKNLNDNILQLSTNRITIDALQNFSSSFYKYLSEVKAIDASYKGQVIEQYLNDFTEKYKHFNIGKTVDAQNILNLISENGFALQYKYIFDNPYKLSEKDQLETVTDGSQYSLIHAKYHRAITTWKQQFGFYDVFLVDQKGNIVYTVNKEIEFTTSLINGPYAKSNLSEVFKQIMTTNQPNFIARSDFAPYLAYYDNQAAFIGTAVFNEAGNKIGAVVVQLSIDNLNSIMTKDRAQWEKMGLGKSVNFVLVGPDFKLRTDNRFFLEDKIKFFGDLKTARFDQNIIDLIKVKNSCIGILPVDTLAVRAALAGKEGSVDYIDYKQTPVIGSFAPLAIPGLNWAIVVKINQAEAFQGIKLLKDNIMQDSVAVGVLIAILAILLGIMTAGSIVKSIYNITDELNNIALSKDLTKRLAVPKNSEFTIMINAFNNFIESIQHAFKNIQHSVVNKAQKTENIAQPADLKKDIFDLVDQVQDLSKEFKIMEDQNDRIKYW